MSSASSTRRGDLEPSESLSCPSLAERAADGSTLIVDELARKLSEVYVQNGCTFNNK